MEIRIGFQYGISQGSRKQLRPVIVHLDGASFEHRYTSTEGRCVEADRAVGKAARALIGMEQTELAEKFGGAIGTIRRMEKF